MLKDSVHEGKVPVIITIGPFYDDIIWFEQLLDVLAEVPELKLYIPRVLLADGTEVEINVLHHMLAAQFTAHTFDVQLTAENNLFELRTLDAHTLAMDKVKHFIAREEKYMNLALLNDEMYAILASQYAVFLPETLQADYAAYEATFTDAVVDILRGWTTHPTSEQVVVLLPIFFSRSVAKQLGSELAIPLATYLTQRREAEEL